MSIFVVIEFTGIATPRSQREKAHIQKAEQILLYGLDQLQVAFTVLGNAFHGRLGKTRNRLPS